MGNYFFVSISLIVKFLFVIYYYMKINFSFVILNLESKLGIVALILTIWYMSSSLALYFLRFLLSFLSFHWSRLLLKIKFDGSYVIDDKFVVSHFRILKIIVNFGKSEEDTYNLFYIFALYALFII